MKIVHICMTGYIDNWGYQENLLPEYMALSGHQITVISSANHFPPFVKNEEIHNILNKGRSYFVNHVKIRRINTYISTSQYSFFVVGLSNLLEEEKPDVIFHHDINSSSMIICWRYCIKHPDVKFFVDNHADGNNQSPRKLWNALVVHGLMRICTSMIQSKVRLFYGVTPGRCEYLKNVFGVEMKKISLFPIGCDTNATDAITANKKELRVKYGLPSDTSVIISGGKMGTHKGTVSLIDACSQLRNGGKDLCLVLFGQFIDEDTKLLAESAEYVYYFGWCNRSICLELLKMSDIACWPIHHTTLIEDAIASSVPLVIRKTSNTSHSIDGNGEFVQHGTEEELVQKLDAVLSNYSQYFSNAEKMHDKYSYTSLVEQFEKDCHE